MGTKSARVGNKGEEDAALYFEQLGFRILAANYHSRFGEIDLIAQDEAKDFLVFIEVKARSKRTLSYGAPAEAVTQRKRKKIIKTALVYLQRNYPNASDVSCRFDVLEIIFNNNALEFNHLENAFDAHGR